MDKKITLAREPGCEGQELRDFLKKQRDLEMEEMAAQRDLEQKTKGDCTTD